MDLSVPVAQAAESGVVVGRFVVAAFFMFQPFVLYGVLKILGWELVLLWYMRQVLV